MAKLNKNVIVLGFICIFLFLPLLFRSLVVSRIEKELRTVTAESRLLKKEVERNRFLFMENLLQLKKEIGSKNSNNIVVYTHDIDSAKQRQTMLHITLDTVVKEDHVYELLVLVSSHSRNTWRRSWIRSLWGNHSVWKEQNWKLVFVAGYEDDDEVMKDLEEEAHKNKDMIIENVLEDFHVMAKKIVIGLTWAKLKMKFNNMLKADDDIFVNIDNAIKFANNNKEQDGYFGNVIVDGLVDRKGRYGVSKKEHLADKYSPYCSGGGFILTNSSVFNLVPFFEINRILKIDDAFVGEVAEKAGVQAKNAAGFYMTNSWCEYKDDVIVSHPAKEHKCMKFLTRRSQGLVTKNSLYE